MRSANELNSEDREHALRRVFESKYAWLLRWALHFTESDRAAAEDLVQETFVRLVLSWDTLQDLDDLEPLLYSYLRYAHLSERRRGRSHAFQRLSSADFDTLAISLRSSSTFDQIEVQNEIRQILLFLMWRRYTARFASMFLLRFFHGYFPEEIASICRTKRFGVDLGLRQARKELKAHLDDPRQVQVFGRSAFPESRIPKRAVPTEEFEEELRQEIYKSSSETCPSWTLLEGYYVSGDHDPLETTLLAHVVACERCLEKAARESGTTPPSSRSMDESLSRAPRGPKSQGKNQKQLLARVFQEGQSRLREIYEHRPTGLVIALNGEVAAVRDIHADTAHATLKVETRDAQKLDMIEVFSEQGMLLLSMPLLRRPPKSQPELRSETLLSNDRTLNLVVRFTRDGALIEANYEDPHCAGEYAEAPEPVLVSDVRSRSEWQKPSSGGEVESQPMEEPRERWAWAGVLRQALGRLTRLAVLIPVSAMLIALALLVLSGIESRDAQRIDANQLLRAAARAEANTQAVAEPTAVTQRILVRTSGKTQEHVLHRDLSGTRQPKEAPIRDDERALREELAEAKIDWEDPLSAQDFRDWHDHLYEEQDQVTRISANLLKVSTKAQSGPVAAETLTVRATDFHAVARTVLMRDGASVEIAELSYEVVPWGPSVEDWFLPNAGSSRLTQPGTPPPHVTSVPRLSDEQLDLAELSAMLALQELHADTERLQVAREVDGVRVVGIVDSDERKAEIYSRLSSIPNVKPAISSYRDLERRSNNPGNPSQLRSVTAADSESPLTIECRQRKIPPDSCRQLSYALLNAATVLERNATRLGELETSYPPTKHLAKSSHELLTAIVTTRFQHMNQALNMQEETLRSLGAIDMQQREDKPAGESSLRSNAETDLALTKELVYASDTHLKPTSDMLRDLARVVETMRGAMAHDAANFPLLSSDSSRIATPRF